MLRIFRQSSRTGIVTTTYPDVAEPAPPAYRGQVLLQTNRCIGDGACARICPSRAIHVHVEVKLDEAWSWELDDARCVFCGLCAEACPTEAILISNEFELAVRDRADLTTKVSFGARSDASSPKEERR
jgi:formate hydrogenlyase subunit 6/NADH:ubiquinone oxidoreductase subunit I